MLVIIKKKEMRDIVIECTTGANAYGLYEYTIKGTEKAFMEIVKMLDK